jgi:hypothetical protein
MGNPRDEAGASDKQARCSQASTPKPDNAQEPRSADEIRRLRPWEPEAGLVLRRRLNNAQLHASARARRAFSPDAEMLFLAIRGIAAQWSMAWSPDPEIDAKLEDILGALTRMFLAADALERNGSGL